MSWLFSQALVEEYLAANSLDGEQSVQSNGNPTQQAYCAPDKMTVFSRLSRFGMMFKPFTVIHGEELSMSSVVAFHVRTFQPLEKESASMESGQECGEKWRGSFVKYDPDSCSWKTHQCSLLGDLDEFSETWPQWGLMRDGECWEQRTLEQTIRGTGCGLSLEMWPTPVKSDYAGRRPSKGWKGDSDLPSVVWTRTGGAQNPQMSPASINATWTEWLMGWPLGWTDLKPLEMDKCLYAPQPHGEYSQKDN
jgi:hypothetical protein